MTSEQTERMSKTHIQCEKATDLIEYLYQHGIEGHEAVESLTTQMKLLVSAARNDLAAMGRLSETSEANSKGSLKAAAYWKEKYDTLRTQLASAETDTESVRLLLDEARNDLAESNRIADEIEKQRIKANADLTEARSQLAEAVAELKQVRTTFSLLWTDFMRIEDVDPRAEGMSDEMKKRRDVVDALLSRLSPSPKQGAGGGEG
ncbi:MAG: hypothetical protein ACX94C_07795 [Phycisphaerales bacterium]